MSLKKVVITASLNIFIINSAFSQVIITNPYLYQNQQNQRYIQNTYPYYGINNQQITPNNSQSNNDLMTVGRTTNDSTKQNPTVTLPNQTNKNTTNSTETKKINGRIIKGKAKIIDGNTIVINEEVIILNGADTYEIFKSCKDIKGYEWNCGSMATDRLKNLINNQEVYCVGVAQGIGGITADCKVGNINLSEAMISNGYASAVDKKYKGIENDARTMKRGLWEGQIRNIQKN